MLCCAIRPYASWLPRQCLMSIVLVHTGHQRGFDDMEPLRQRYACTACHTRFDDLTDTIFAGYHPPLKVRIRCLYFMGLHQSNENIAHELDADHSDVHQMTMPLHTRTHTWPPPGDRACLYVMVQLQRNRSTRRVELLGQDGRLLAVHPIHCLKAMPLKSPCACRL
jgi:transposase-like protein